MKIKYIGETFGALSLTSNKIYEAEVDSDSGAYRVWDDSGDPYLYSPINPGPADGSAKGGKWEIIKK